MSTVGNKGGPYRDIQGGEYPALTIVDEFQRAVHDGQAYSLSAHGQLAAAPGVVQFLGLVGDKEVHFDGFIAQLQKGGVHVHLYEAPTVTLNGTPAPVYTKNRAKIIAATLQTFSAPTIAAKGVQIYNTLPPLTGSGVNVSPSEGNISGGWVLKKNTAYLFELENTDNSTTNFDVVFEWHESNISLGV